MCKFVYVPLDNKDKKEEMIEKKILYLKLSKEFTAPFKTYFIIIIPFYLV